MAPKKHNNTEGNCKLPGELVLKVCKLPGLRSVAKHMHTEQITYDHQYLWLSAKTPVEKRAVLRRYRMQLALSTGQFIGFEIGMHGIVTFTFGEFLWGSTVLLIGALIMKITKGDG